MLEKNIPHFLYTNVLAAAISTNAVAQENYYSLTFPDGLPSAQIPLILSKNQEAKIRKSINGGIDEIITIYSTGKYKRRVELEFKDGKCKSELTMEYHGKIPLLNIESYSGKGIVTSESKNASCKGVRYLELFERTRPIEGDIPSTLSNEHGQYFNRNSGINGNYSVHVDIRRDIRNLNFDSIQIDLTRYY